MAAMTSLSHPLRIAEVPTRSGGRVGLTFCPGKTQRYAVSGNWDRDLGLDLDAVRTWGADVVLSLIEDHEFRELAVQDLPRAVAMRGMAWHHLPIKDGSVPGEAFEAAYERVKGDLHRRLAMSGAVLVHCKGGLGRAGLVTARLLIETGDDPGEAIRLVRAVRPGAIETAAQEAYIIACRGLDDPIVTSRGKTATVPDWFERLTGFREGDHEDTRQRLSVVDGRLQADGRDRGVAVGTLTLPSLAELRLRAAIVPHSGRPRLTVVEGDVRAMHAAAVNEGALFQVASQFNMLEMVSPDVTPEDGVTGYHYDRTQGPACAMAAGAATIFRNYLVPVDGGVGQTAVRQLDGLADLAILVQGRLGSNSPPWSMRNGYAMVSREGLAAIDAMLAEADEIFLGKAKGALRVGLHSDVEVTDKLASGRKVSQIFCSALPVAYCGHPSSAWARFAGLVLEAAYEATLLAAVLNAARGASNRVLLTRLGGGAFGNCDAWIDAATARALRAVSAFELDVVVVSYGAAPRSLRQFVSDSGYAPAPATET